MSDRSHDTWESEPADPADQLNQVMYSDSMWYHRGNGEVPAYSSPEEEQLSLRELRNAFGVPSTVSSYDQGIVSRLAGPVPGDERLVGTGRAPPPRLDSYQGVTQGPGHSDANAYHVTVEASQYARAQLGRQEYAERNEYDHQLIQSIPLNLTDTSRRVAGSGPAWVESPGTLGHMLPRHEAGTFPSHHTPWKVFESSPSTDCGAYKAPVKEESNVTTGSASSSVTMVAASPQSSTGTLPESVKGAQWTHFGRGDRSIATEQYLPILTMSQEAELPESAEPEEGNVWLGRHLSRRDTARGRRNVGNIPRQVVSDAIGPMSKTERALHDLDAWDGCPKDERGSR